MAKKPSKKKFLLILVSFFKKYRLFILVFLVISLLLFLLGKILLVASVNGKIITRFAVINELEKQGGKEILDSILIKTLISQEAKKRKLVITKAEINKELAKIEVNVTSQGVSLEELLNQQGLTKKDLEEQIVLQLQLGKMVDDKVTITPEEIQQYLSYSTDLTEEDAKAAIKEQKLQEKIQSFIADLKNKAKINYFIKY